MSKIAYITGTFPAWSETFVAQELELLLACEDLAILPIALRPGDGDFPARIHYLYERDRGRDHSATPSAGGLRTTALPATVQRRLSLLRHGGALRDLVALLRAESVSHVYAACGDLPGLLAATAAAKLGISHSVSVHAHDVFCPKYPDDAIFGSAAFIATCNSLAYQTVIQRLPQLEDRTYLIPHGLRLANWPFRQGPYRAARPIRLLFVGRLVEKKQPDHCLDILKALKSQGIPAHLSIVGDGPLRAHLEQRINTEILPVNFHGSVPRKLVREIMMEHDALICTSTETASRDAEGIPNVILEAMASGLPVLTNQTGAVADACSPDTALFIDSSQPQSAIDHIQALIDGASWVKDMLRNARRLITEEYDALELIEARRLLLALAVQAARAAG